MKRAGPTRVALNRRGRSYLRPAGLDLLFWSRITRTEGCWEWPGERSHIGYGVVYRKEVGTGRELQIMAHRYAYEDIHGQVPYELDLDHLCRNRGCVRPDHLEPVTHEQNMRRSAAATKTHCIRGHVMPEPVLVKGRPRRMCKECGPARAQERREALAATHPKPGSGAIDVTR